MVESHSQEQNGLKKWSKERQLKESKHILVINVILSLIQLEGVSELSEKELWEKIFRPPCFGTPDYYACLIEKKCPRFEECHKLLQERLYEGLRVMKWRTRAFKFQIDSGQKYFTI